MHSQAIHHISADPISCISYLAGLRRYQQAFYFLIWKDLKLRFRHKVFTLASIFLQPLLSSLALVACFSHVAEKMLVNHEYPACVFLGMLIWQFVSRAINLGAGCLRHNSDAIARVYFPRILIPLAVVVIGAIDLLIALPGLLIMMRSFHIPFQPHSLFLIPLLLFILFAFSLALGLGFAIIDFEYNDVTFMMPFINQFFFFISPIAYLSSSVGKEWKAVLSLNPLSVVVEGLRTVLFSTPPPSTLAIGTAFLETLVLVSGMVWLFCRCETRFGDKTNA